MLADLATADPSAFERTLDVCVIGAGPAGITLARRLAAKGITALMTSETDPDRAVAAYLQGTLGQGAGACEHGAHH